MAERKIQDQADQEKTLRGQKKEVEAEIQETAANQEGGRTREQELRQQFEDKRETAKSAKKTFGEVERRREKLRREMTILSEEIARLRTNASDYEEKCEERRRAMAGLEAQVLMFFFVCPHSRPSGGCPELPSRHHLDSLYSPAAECEGGGAGGAAECR